jgi:hypothetical protein
MPRMPSSARRPTRRAAPKKPKKLVPVLARLQPAQLAALRAEATRRARDSGGRRADVSEVAREAISIWMAIRPAQRAIIRAVAARRELTRPEVLRGAIDAWLTTLEPDGSQAGRAR